MKNSDTSTWLSRHIKAGPDRTRHRLRALAISRSRWRKLRLGYPPAVNLANGAHRQLHNRHRSLSQVLGIENQQIRAPGPLLTRRNAQQVPGTFGGVGAARCEAALRQRGPKTGVIQRCTSILVVKARIAGARRARIWH